MQQARHTFLKSISIFMLGLVAILGVTSASAAIMQHTFSISGTGGETGTGTFTWDNSVVSNGSSLSGLPATLLSVTITISGGNVVGGTTTFHKADCTDSALNVTPNFAIDINFWCDNGTNTLNGVAPYTNSLNSGASTLTFTPGTTSAVAPATVPTLSEWGMVVLSLLLAGGTVLTLRRQRL